MTRRKNFYAVRAGRTPGIYRSWEECQREIAGYSRAEYKGFATREEAEAYMRGEDQPSQAKASHQPVLQETEKGQLKFSEVSGPEGVVLYTDGACSGNPGPGGYGVVLLQDGQRAEFSAGFRRTTNNRMEMLACIVGLKALDTPSRVILYSDSRYVVDAVTKSWAVNWRRRGWKRRVDNGELVPAANADLWAELLDLTERHQVNFQWVRGHDGNVENERCDALARAATASGDLGVDTQYERNGSSPS